MNQITKGRILFRQNGPRQLSGGLLHQPLLRLPQVSHPFDASLSLQVCCFDLGLNKLLISALHILANAVVCSRLFCGGVLNKSGRIAVNQEAPLPCARLEEDVELHPDTNLRLQDNLGMSPVKLPKDELLLFLLVKFFSLQHS